MEDSNDYNKDIYKTNAFFSPYSETLDFLLSPFNDNFAINFLPVVEPDFNHNFTNIDSFSLETPSKPSINPSLELLSEPSLELSPEPFSEPSSEPSCETPFELPFEEHFESLSEQVYQYNLTVGDYFDDWQSVDTFMHQYCLERGFGYQVYRNDKDPNDFTIIRRKSFRCSSNGKYESRKVIDQKLHRLRGTIKTNCEWHCNFSFPKMANQVKCTSLKDIHNHEVNPTQLPHIIARYRRFDNEMIKDLKFFLDCKVAPIIQLEILKRKYPEHVFHKQDVYNAIYNLCQNNKNERPDSLLFLDILFEKITQDPRWKVFVRHTGSENRLSGIFWMSPSQQELYRRFSDIVLNDNTCKTNKYNMYLSVFMIKDNYGRFRNVANALIEDELSSTYTWILQCLVKATDNIIPKSFWTDSEPGLINAVAQVFPNTPHFYCMFHIWQNIIKYLKSKLGENFSNFSKAFYACRNALCIEIFEQRWEFMIKSFPNCERYMTRTLYNNRISWAKAYMPFQFNGGIQSTQSVESFNGIIKRSLNSTSTLCEVEEAINKRYEEEIRYCQLTDLKAKYTTVGLPHLSSQFFSDVDTVIVEFLTPLILSLQRFQISQSFTYEGQLISCSFDVCIIS